MEHNVYSYKQFEYILKKNKAGLEEQHLNAPVPTNHVNMRGSGYYK